MTEEAMRCGMIHLSQTDDDSASWVLVATLQHHLDKELGFDPDTVDGGGAGRLPIPMSTAHYLVDKAVHSNSLGDTPKTPLSLPLAYLFCSLPPDLRALVGGAVKRQGFTTAIKTLLIEQLLNEMQSSQPRRLPVSPQLMIQLLKRKEKEASTLGSVGSTSPTEQWYADGAETAHQTIATALCTHGLAVAVADHDFDLPKLYKCLPFKQVHPILQAIHPQSNYRDVVGGTEVIDGTSHHIDGPFRQWAVSASSATKDSHYLLVVSGVEQDLHGIIAGTMMDVVLQGSNASGLRVDLRTHPILFLVRRPSCGAESAVKIASGTSRLLRRYAPHIRFPPVVPESLQQEIISRFAPYFPDDAFKAELLTRCCQFVHMSMKALCVKGPQRQHRRYFCEAEFDSLLGMVESALSQSKAAQLALPDIDTSVKRLVVECALDVQCGRLSERELNSVRAFFNCFLSWKAYQEGCGICSAAGFDEDEEDEFGDEEEAAMGYTVLPCQHTFHSKCIHQWVEAQSTSRSSPECPNCRVKFLFEAMHLVPCYQFAELDQRARQLVTQAQKDGATDRRMVITPSSRQLMTKAQRFIDSLKFATNHSKFGMLIEGPSGRGKDLVIDILLQANKFTLKSIDEADSDSAVGSSPSFAHINAALQSTDTVQRAVAKCVANGWILVISELNLLPPTLIDAIVSNIYVWKEQHQPQSKTFGLFATINPPETTQGRGLVTPSMERFFIQASLGAYDPVELLQIADVSAGATTESQRAIISKVQEVHSAAVELMHQNNLHPEPTIRKLVQSCGAILHTVGQQDPKKETLEDLIDLEVTKLYATQLLVLGFPNAAALVEAAARMQTPSSSPLRSSVGSSRRDFAPNILVQLAGGPEVQGVREFSLEDAFIVLLRRLSHPGDPGNRVHTLTLISTAEALSLLIKNFPYLHTNLPLASHPKLLRALHYGIFDSQLADSMKELQRKYDHFIDCVWKDDSGKWPASTQISRMVEDARQPLGLDRMTALCLGTGVLDAVTVLHSHGSLELFGQQLMQEHAAGQRATVEKHESISRDVLQAEAHRILGIIVIRYGSLLKAASKLKSQAAAEDDSDELEDLAGDRHSPIQEGMEAEADQAEEFEDDEPIRIPGAQGHTDDSIADLLRILDVDGQGGTAQGDAQLDALSRGLPRQRNLSIPVPLGIEPLSEDDDNDPNGDPSLQVEGVDSRWRLPVTVGQGPPITLEATNYRSGLPPYFYPSAELLEKLYPLVDPSQLTLSELMESEAAKNFHQMFLNQRGSTIRVPAKAQGFTVRIRKVTPGCVLDIPHITANVNEVKDIRIIFPSSMGYQHPLSESLQTLQVSSVTGGWILRLRGWDEYLNIMGPPPSPDSGAWSRSNSAESLGFGSSRGYDSQQQAFYQSHPQPQFPRASSQPWRQHQFRDERVTVEIVYDLTSVVPPGGQPALTDSVLRTYSKDVLRYTSGQFGSHWAGEVVRDLDILLESMRKTADEQSPFRYVTFASLLAHLQSNSSGIEALPLVLQFIDYAMGYGTSTMRPSLIGAPGSLATSILYAVSAGRERQTVQQGFAFIFTGNPFKRLDGSRRAALIVLIIRAMLQDAVPATLVSSISSTRVGDGGSERRMRVAIYLASRHEWLAMEADEPGHLWKGAWTNSFFSQESGHVMPYHLVPQGDQWHRRLKYFQERLSENATIVQSQLHGGFFTDSFGFERIMTCSVGRLIPSRLVKGCADCFELTVLSEDSSAKRSQRRIAVVGFPSVHVSHHHENPLKLQNQFPTVNTAMQNSGGLPTTAAAVHVEYLHQLFLAKFEIEVWIPASPTTDETGVESPGGRRSGSSWEKHRVQSPAEILSLVAEHDLWDRNEVPLLNSHENDNVVVLTAAKIAGFLVGFVDKLATCLETCALRQELSVKRHYAWDGNLPPVFSPCNEGEAGRFSGVTCEYLQEGYRKTLKRYFANKDIHRREPTEIVNYLALEVGQAVRSLPAKVLEVARGLQSSHASYCFLPQIASRTGLRSPDDEPSYQLLTSDHPAKVMIELEAHERLRRFVMPTGLTLHHAGALDRLATLPSLAELCLVGVNVCATVLSSGALSQSLPKLRKLTMRNCTLSVDRFDISQIERDENRKRAILRFNALQELEELSIVSCPVYDWLTIDYSQCVELHRLRYDPFALPMLTPDREPSAVGQVIDWSALVNLRSIELRCESGIQVFTQLMRDATIEALVLPAHAPAALNVGDSADTGTSQWLPSSQQTIDGIRSGLLEQVSDFLEQCKSSNLFSKRNSVKVVVSTHRVGAALKALQKSNKVASNAGVKIDVVVDSSLQRRVNQPHIVTSLRETITSVLLSRDTIAQSFHRALHTCLLPHVMEVVDSLAPHIREDSSVAKAVRSSLDLRFNDSLRSFPETATDTTSVEAFLLQSLALCHLINECNCRSPIVLESRNTSVLIVLENAVRNNRRGVGLSSKWAMSSRLNADRQLTTEGEKVIRILGTVRDSFSDGERDQCAKEISALEANLLEAPSCYRDFKA